MMTVIQKSQKSQRNQKTEQHHGLEDHGDCGCNQGGLWNDRFETLDVSRLDHFQCMWGWVTRQQNSHFIALR
jgi:hypothetical protein